MPYQMTAKQLRKALKEVPDDAWVIVEPPEVDPYGAMPPMVVVRAEPSTYSGEEAIELFLG